MQRLRGVASVSDTGEANWHLQLTVPPGRAGWEPNLTLSYSSGRGSSVYGVGFDLSVGSRIHRCGQDIDLDGDTTAVRFTDDDRLCLNGVRLVATDATSSYWSSSAEYRVESRAVDRIRRANPSTGYVFEITHRDGSRTYYGGKNAATASVRHGDRNPDGTMQAGPHGELEWLIAREEDRSGNQIDYEYDLDESSDGSFEHLLDRIRYTGHATRAPTREIVFEYEARSASENFFTAGAHRLLSQRVKEIRMNVSGSLVRRYPLEYELSAGGRDVLKEITECDRFATCRPPTTFDWSDQTVSSAGGSWSSFDLPKGWDFGEAWESMLEVGDFNGDGLDDIVYHERTNGGSNRRIFMRFGWVTTTPEPGVVLSHPVSTFTPPIDTGLSRDVQREAGFPNLRWFTVVDHDEDGTDELIVQQVSASTPDAWSWDLYDVLPSGPSPADGATVHLLDEAYLDCTTWIDWVIPGPIVGDFNGDGGADAFGTCLSESGVLDHRAASFDWMAQRASAFPVSNQALGDDPLWTQRVVADLNGDGKQEVLTWPAGYDPNGLGILDHLGGAPSPDPTLTSLLTIGTPAGEMPAIHLPLQDFTHPSGEDIEISYVFLDINGDGLQDALTLDTTGGPTLRLNTGRGFGPPQSPFDPSLPTLDYLLLSATSAVQVADFNHDGRDDMLVPFHRGAGAATPPAVRLHLSRGETFEVLDLAAPGERTDLPAIPASAPPQQLRFALSQVRLMDRNGDGVREFSQIRNGRLEFDTINAGPGDRLIAVHDGGTFPHFVYGFDTAEVPTDPLHAYPRAAMAPQRVVVTLKHTLGDSGDHFVDHWFRDGLVDVRRRTSLGYGTHSFRNDDDLITRYQFDRTLADVGNRLDLTVNAGLPARRLYEDWSSGSCDEGRDVRYTYQTQTDDSATDAYRVLTEVEEDRSYDCSFGTSETDLVPFFQHRTDRAFDSWGTLKEETITDLLGADRTVATYVLENLIGPFQIGLIRERYITSIVEGDVASRTTFFDYHPDGRLKTETAEPGGGPELRVEFHHDYDAFGNEERFEIKAGSESRVTETVYAGDSIYPSLVRNALGHEIELLFDDGLGALLDEEAVNPHGPNRHQWARYDGFGQPVQMHRQGVDDLVEYEAVGDHILVHVNAASGRSTTGEVNGRGQLVRAVRRHGSGASSYYQQVFEYDPFGRLERRSNWHGPTDTPSFESISYDAWSRALTHDNLFGGQRSWAYDGRIETRTEPTGGEYETRRNSAGRVDRRREPSVDGTRSDVTYGYRPFGLLGTATDVYGNVQRYWYDTRGRAEEVIDPDEGTTRYQYDGFGSLTRVIDVDPVVQERRRFSYDALGRLEQIVDSLDGKTEYYWDDAAGFGLGQLRRVDGPDADTRFEYDNFGRQERIEQTALGATLFAEMDYGSATGRLQSIKVPALTSGTVQYSLSYSSFGELGLVEFNGSTVWKAKGRNDALRRVTKDIRGDVTLTRDYDPTHHLMDELRATAGGSAFVDRDSYQYRVDGRIENFDELVAGETQRFGYDMRGRLSSWSRGAANISYRYDPIGNQYLGASGTRSFGQGGAGPHMVTTSGSTSLTYDERGRRTGLGGGQTATYTNFDLPRTIDPAPNWFSNDPTLTYAYDGFEQQIGHTSDNGDVEVRLGDLLERHVVGGTTSMLYAVYAEGERVAEIEATPGNKFNPVVYTTRAIVNDRQGTSLASVEGSTVTQGPILEPFGMTMSGSTEDQRFASHAFDATGYVNARGRYYDPATANFMTTDPVRVPTAEHMNLYGYAAADPSNRTDPTGFFPDDGPIGGGAPTTPPATPSGGGGGDLPPMRDPGPGAGAPTGGAQRIRQTNASAQNRANRRRQPRRGRRSRDETAHESQDRRGGVITLVFPGFPTDTETELGRIAAIHAAFVAVQPNGRVRYFEYGRYGGPRGRVRERTIPFRLRFNSDGEPTDRSMRRLLRLVSRRYGRGASVRGEFFSDADPDAAIRYALHRQRDRDRRDYSLIDNTCVEFVVGALDASMSLFDRIVAWPTFYYLTGNTIDYGDDSL